ncbi:hypothetical protein HY469_04265 [Candidatus Roizmanbacteria bacterium]|nr:hypothetical protein [Candidatus Roizmanbacteria bacterium]
MDEQSQSSETMTAQTGKIGCGAMIAFLIIALILFIIGANEAIGYYLDHCNDEDIIECFLNRTEEEAPEGAVTATGPYSYKDYSVNITMNIPLEGGGVTGTMSGTCDGMVKGTFDGQNNGVISGRITGSCSPFVVNIPASAEFSGTVNKDSKVVPINFTGKGAGMTHKDSMSLTY